MNWYEATELFAQDDRAPIGQTKNVASGSSVSLIRTLFTSVLDDTRRRVGRRSTQLRGRCPGVDVIDHVWLVVIRALDAWARRDGVRLQFIRPGKPVENAHVESFNGRLRDECLNQYAFVSMDDARKRIEA